MVLLGGRFVFSLDLAVQVLLPGALGHGDERLVVDGTHHGVVDSLAVRELGEAHRSDDVPVYFGVVDASDQVRIQVISDVVYPEEHRCGYLVVSRRKVVNFAALVQV